MKQSIGPIFKLVREQKRVKLKEIAKQCNQPISKLSEFENGKKKFTEEELRALYQCLQLNYPSKDTMQEEVEQGCKQMFDSICYCEDKEGEILEALRKQKPMIFCDFSYITYLLCELLYCVYHPFQGDNSQTLIQIIESRIAYLSEEARTLFYDTAGVYYKNEKQIEKALEYFNKGFQHHRHDALLAMLSYHNTMALTTKGELKEAEEYGRKALEIFSYSLMIKRVIMTQLYLGTICSRRYDFEQAEYLFLQNKKALDLVPMKKKIATYNNLMWMYFLWGKYDKVLKYSAEAIEIDPSYGYTYCYLTYTYWLQKEDQKAKEALKEAKLHMDGIDGFDRAMLMAMSSILNKKSFELQERRVLEAYNEAEKKDDKQLKKFALEVLIIICHEYGKLEKEISYRIKLEELLKQRY